MRTTIDNNLIDGLAGNKQATAAFPFLAKRTSTACCGRRQTPDYDFIKLALMNLSEADQVKFKEIVGAKKVVIFPPRGKITEF